MMQPSTPPQSAKTIPVFLTMRISCSGCQDMQGCVVVATHTVEVMLPSGRVMVGDASRDIPVIDTTVRVVPGVGAGVMLAVVVEPKVVVVVVKGVVVVVVVVVAVVVGVVVVVIGVGVVEG